MAVSQARQNFSQDCEDAINGQINQELYASYTYLSMVSYIFLINLFFSKR
jgi:ferritin